jgi:hypothetical protein
MFSVYSRLRTQQELIFAYVYIRDYLCCLGGLTICSFPIHGDCGYKLKQTEGK